MALADDIRSLSTRSLAALDAAHEYHAHTKGVWRLIHEIVREGRRFSITDRLTGNVMNQDSIPALAQQYISDYHTSFTFQHFVSLFEHFFFDLARLWLSAYPESLSSRGLTFGEVLKAPDKSAITQSVVDRVLNEISYQRVADWFTYLDRLVKLNCPTAGEIERLAEIKASRDVFVHNRGIANAIYVAKAGGRARAGDGDALELTERYHRES
jgi:hypothetical protein